MLGGGGGVLPRALRYATDGCTMFQEDYARYYTVARPAGMISPSLLFFIQLICKLNQVQAKKNVIIIIL